MREREGAFCEGLVGTGKMGRTNMDMLLPRW